MSKMFIYPCNPTQYDVAEHFANHDYIVWRAISNIAPDDIVFIYVGKTKKEVKYRCVVTPDVVTKEILQENSYAIPKGKLANKCSYIMLRKCKEYDDGTYPLSELENNGMKQFMVPMHVSDNLEQYLRKKDLELGEV